MSSVATKIEQFEVPVCNSFQIKVLNEQLCYEIDLNEFSNENNLDRELKSGLIFMMYYNEDRQVTFNHNYNRRQDKNLTSTFVESDKDLQAVIYLNTVGEH